MFSTLIDETGSKYGRLTVVRYAGGKQARWFCVCFCGGTKITTGTNLRKGITKSCGCLQTEHTRSMGKRNKTHGHTAGGLLTSTFISWSSMLQRCLNKNHHAYSRYGGSTPPVEVCSAWKSFDKFLRDMGNRPKGTSLGRLGDVGNYTKKNCKWMTRSEQGKENWKKRRLNAKHEVLERRRKAH